MPEVELPATAGPPAAAPKRVGATESGAGRSRASGVTATGSAVGGDGRVAVAGSEECRERPEWSEGDMGRGCETGLCKAGPRAGPLSPREPGVPEVELPATAGSAGPAAALKSGAWAGLSTPGPTAGVSAWGTAEVSKPEEDSEVGTE